MSKKISTDILDLEEDVQFGGKNEFAKNYDSWRKKEEFNKLKSKYGEDALEDSESSSSDDDEYGAELTEEVEKDFFKTLSFLKKKDPAIYKNDVNFFTASGADPKRAKKKKDEAMFLKDYERKLILEKAGVVSDEEDERPRSPTYVEEQTLLKQNIKNALSNISDDEDESYLSQKKENPTKTMKEESYKKWLAGKDEIEDDSIKSDLKPLKDFWNDPNLDDGESFLRDYILNKKYLDKEQEDYIPSYDEIIHDSDDNLSGDEKAIEQQEDFEHKYNFRFEEPDQDFIKRYPRTIEKSLRKTDDRRKIKRAETKERKQKEKEEKMGEIEKLKELKRKEIEEKINKLKEVTGSTHVGFQKDDVDDDFDPEAYDKRMQALFNDEFYQGEEGEQKPEFPEIDEELGIEPWNEKDIIEDLTTNEPYCEDDDFIMDADYDPSTSKKEKQDDTGKSRKKRKRKSKIAEAISRPKPKYDPNDKNFEKYFDEYYQLDCEDIIGDIHCRFKYKEVVPVDFGLSIEEILLAKDKELNRWCSLKKTMQIRPEHVEKYDQIAYAKKAQNISLKQKILPSLFSNEADENSDNKSFKPTQKSVEAKEAPEVDNTLLEDTQNEEHLKKTNNKKKTLLNKDDILVNKSDCTNEETEKLPENDTKKQKTQIIKKEKQAKKKGKKSATSSNVNGNIDATKNVVNSKKRKNSSQNKHGGKKLRKNEGAVTDISDARLSAYGFNPKKFKNKIKYGNKEK